MKIKELYKNPKHWIQGIYTNGRGGYCLAGAITHCYKKYEDQQTVTLKVRQAIKQYKELKRLPNHVVSFNDSKKTEYKDVMAVLKIANV